jgi:hypothetical protein
VDTQNPSVNPGVGAMGAIQHCGSNLAIRQSGRFDL